MKQQGFSLVELVTVLLIITVLSTIAIRSTVEIGYNARYEQTKERLNSIKQAIIGNPNRYLNSQPDIHGFVADMGRLPVNLRELVDQNYCTADRTIDETNYDSATYASAQAHCNAISAGAWKAQTAPGSSNGLSFGWRGPYLTVSDSVISKDLYTDGWGRESQNSTDFNYGWVYQIGSPNTDDLTIQSYGKNQAAGGTDDYDADYPPTSSQPVISNTDWKVAISNGITISLQKPYMPTFRACGFLASQASSFTTAIDCQNAGGNWNGTTCTIIDAASCKLVGGTWQSCLFDSAQCANFTAGAGTTWRSSCEFTENSCNASTGGTTNTTGAVGWDGTNHVCITATSPTKTCPGANCSYTTPTACENNQGTWVQRCIFNDSTACTTALPTGAGGTWDTNNPNSCLLTTAQCFSAQGLTNGGECYLTHQEGQTTATRYTESSCKTAKGVWFRNTSIYSPLYRKNSVCVKFFYRKGSSIDSLISDNDISTASPDPFPIEENGSYQTITFNNFKDNTNTVVTDIPIGINAIGIYEYDGSSCSTSTNLYPSDRTAPIPVLFAPHRNLPVIQW